MPELSIKVSGEKEVIGSFNAMEGAILSKVKDVLSANGDLLEVQIRSGAKKATGELMRAITKRTWNDGLSVAVKAARSWWVYGEWGMGPLGQATGGQTPKWLKHKAMTKLPSPTSLRFVAWCKLKGLKPFAVSKNIFKRKGVKAKPYVRPPIEANEERIANEIRSAIGSGTDAAFKVTANIR